MNCPYRWFHTLIQQRLKVYLHRVVERANNCHERICIIIAKHPIQSIPMKIRKRRLIEHRRVHHSLLSQKIDGLLDKADLVGTELLVF